MANLVTLYRQAPVAPHALICALCDAEIRNSLQDHLLMGQPGTSDERAAICPRCGQVLARLVELCGNNLTLLVQDQRPSLDSLVGVPNRGDPR
jgi:hypothetical protein